MYIIIIIIITNKKSIFRPHENLLSYVRNEKVTLTSMMVAKYQATFSTFFNVGPQNILCWTPDYLYMVCNQ